MTKQVTSARRSTDGDNDAVAEETEREDQYVSTHTAMAMPSVFIYIYKNAIS